MPSTLTNDELRAYVRHMIRDLGPSAAARKLGLGRQTALSLAADVRVKEATLQKARACIFILQDNGEA